MVLENSYITLIGYGFSPTVRRHFDEMMGWETRWAVFNNREYSWIVKWMGIQSYRSSAATLLIKKKKKSSGIVLQHNHELFFTCVHFSFPLSPLPFMMNAPDTIPKQPKYCTIISITWEQRQAVWGLLMSSQSAALIYSFKFKAKGERHLAWSIF